MSSDSVRELQARLCRSTGYPIRLEILDALRDGPKRVRDLSEILGREESTVSRHLSILRSAGILTVVHRRQSAYYEVANPKLLKVCDLMREALEERRLHDVSLARGI